MIDSISANCRTKADLLALGCLVLGAVFIVYLSVLYEGLGVRGAGYGTDFLTYETEFVLILAVLENSVWPMGCDSSHVPLK